MTTVGYGDVYAVSPFGRVISIVNAFWGSFLISMLVGLIGGIFQMNEKQKLAVTDINKFKQAGASVRATIKYYNARQEFNRNAKIPIEERYDYVPTREEVAKLRDTMYKESIEFKQVRKNNDELLPEPDVASQDLKVVKDQILDLNDKFDYLMYLMIKGEKLSKNQNKEEFAFMSPRHEMT